MIDFVLCILVADFLVGFVHWAEDTYGTPNWIRPLDTQIVLPNIDHHRKPSAIGSASNWFTRNYVPVIAFLLLFVAITILFGFSLRLFWVGLFASLGNEVHTWNHRKAKDNPGWVRFLQDTGLVQTRQQHNRHHVPPYDCYYCTLTNVVNAFLEPLRFWRGLEWCLSCLGISVKRGSTERGGF